MQRASSIIRACRALGWQNTSALQMNQNVNLVGKIDLNCFLHPTPAHSHNWSSFSKNTAVKQQTFSHGLVFVCRPKRTSSIFCKENYYAWLWLAGKMSGCGTGGRPNRGNKRGQQKGRREEQVEEYMHRLLPTSCTPFTSRTYPWIMRGRRRGKNDGVSWNFWFQAFIGNQHARRGSPNPPCFKISAHSGSLVWCVLYFRITHLSQN